VALALLAAGLAVAAPAGATWDEYEVKAAFLLNFARLVEWPAAARPAAQDLVVAVLGSKEVERVISRSIGDESVGERSVTVRRISGPEEVAGSHIVFVSRDADDLAPVLDAARAHAALAVGESEGFARNGGVINFFVEDKRLRFEINTDAASRARLKVSSRLLRLAVLIQSGG
jgi:hypothetical protein